MNRSDAVIAGSAPSRRLSGARVTARLAGSLLALLLASCPVLAQQIQPQHDTAVSFTLENDRFFGTDRYYTDGAQFTWKHRVFEPWDSTGRLLAAVCQRVGCDGHALVSVQARAGQLMYTPVDIGIAAAQPGDRPWAGLLYYARDYGFLSGDGSALTTITGQIGVMGPGSQVEATQKFIHRIVGSREPMGWSNQIGGQLGLLASVERRFALSPRPLPENAGKVELRSSAHWRVAAGNIMTYGAAGVNVMIGKGLPWVSPQETGIPDKLMRAAESAATPDTSCLVSWLRCTAFATAEARLMARNFSLDGPAFQDGPSVKRRPLVGDLSAGLRLDFPRSGNVVTGPWFVQFKATRRTPEFRGSGPLRSHSFGALTLGTEL